MKPGKVLMFGLAGLVLAQLIAYWQQSANPLLASVLTVAAGSIPLLIEYAKQRESATVATGEHASITHSSARPTPGAPARPFGFGGLVLGLALLVALGGGLAWGASYLLGRVTGTEHTTARLVAPVSGKAGALVVRVDEVGVGDHTTQLLVTATNRAEFGVKIPLYNNCQLLERGRPALAALTGFTTSVLDVPAGTEPITQRLVFSSTPSDAETTLVLSCSNLFWQGFGQPNSLQVKGIKLTARA